MIDFKTANNSLTCYHDNEILNIMPWGRDGVRIRATRLNAIRQDWLTIRLKLKSMKPGQALVMVQ